MRPHDRPRSRRLVTSIAALGLTCGATWVLPRPGLAARPKTVECLDASEGSLTLGDVHKLRAERSLLLVCAAVGCPTDIRKECAARVAEVSDQIPTIIFAAKDASGGDLSAVKVTMDGELLAERLDGTALATDPGEHRFRFEMAGQPPLEKKLVMHEGEKDRREVIVLIHRARLTIRAGPSDSIALDGQPLAAGSWQGDVDGGVHTLRVAAPGMAPYQAEVTLQDGGTRTVEVTLKKERVQGVPTWAWIAGGVLVAAGASVGGYFLFKSPGATTIPVPQGSLGSVQLASGRW